MLHLALCLQPPDKTDLGLGWFQKTKDRLHRQLEYFTKVNFAVTQLSVNAFFGRFDFLKCTWKAQILR